jgi:hypothetical protein
MKLLYIGTHFCPADSLARLMLLGNELCFLDRPSVTFDNWGTIGHDSYMRNISFGESPIKISILKPPSGPADALYAPYVQADIANPDFIAAFLDGLRADNVFAERFLQPKANYGDGRTGVDVRRLLNSDPSLYQASLDLARGDPSLMYKPETAEGRQAILRSLIVDASIQVTSALLIADEIDALPVGDDATFPKLLSLRASNTKYVGGTPKIAPFLGLQFAKSVIPEEALRKLEFKDIFAYRNKTKELYESWNTELNRVSAKIDEAELTHPAETIRTIIASELAPKIKRYENEMASIRDNLFGSLIKGVISWELPTISISYIADLGYAGAVAVFVAAARATIPHLVDFEAGRRAIKRKHAVSYLVGLTRN